MYVTVFSSLHISANIVACLYTFTSCEAVILCYDFKVHIHSNALYISLWNVSVLNEDIVRDSELHWLCLGILDSIFCICHACLLC